MVDTEFPRNRGGYSSMDFLFSATRTARPIGGIPTCLYLWLAEQNFAGAYPGTAAIARLFDVHGHTIVKAEKILVRSGLLRLEGVGQRKTYSLIVPVKRTTKQRVEWETASNETCRDRGLEAAIRAAAQEPPPDVVVAPEEPIQVVQQPAPEQPAIAGAETVNEVIVDLGPARAIQGNPPSPGLIPQEAQGRFQSVPEATPTPAPKPEPEKPKAKKTMTPAAAAWFLESPDHIEAYLRFGGDAYGKTLEEIQGMPSEGTDWLSHKPADLIYPFEKNWTIPQFMGFFWSGVSRWRAENQYPLTFPQFSRMAGDVRNLLKSTTPFDAFSHIWIVIYHFDLIRHLLGRIGQNMVLDETSLSHSLIKQQVLVIRQRGQDWIAHEYELINAKLAAIADDEE